MAKARTYNRDARGRFASGGGGGGGGRPKARAVAKGANRLTRDNAGKITSVGGTGATARGGRLRTASGKQRGTQVARVKGGAVAGSTIAKGGRSVSGKVARSLAAVKKESDNKEQTVIPSARRSYRTKAQAAAAQKERNRRLYEYGMSAPGRGYLNGISGNSAPKSFRKQQTMVNQQNLLTGGTDRIAVKTRLLPGGSRIKRSAEYRKTETRRARAEARYEQLLQERKSTMGKGRVKAGILAKNSQRMAAVSGAFRVYDMGTGRKPKMRTTGRR